MLSVSLLFSPMSPYPMVPLVWLFPPIEPLCFHQRSYDSEKPVPVFPLFFRAIVRQNFAQLRGLPVGSITLIMPLDSWILLFLASFGSCLQRVRLPVSRIIAICSLHLRTITPWVYGANVEMAPFLPFLFSFFF